MTNIALKPFTEFKRNALLIYIAFIFQLIFIIYFSYKRYDTQISDNYLTIAGLIFGFTLVIFISRIKNQFYNIYQEKKLQKEEAVLELKKSQERVMRSEAIYLLERLSSLININKSDRDEYDRLLFLLSNSEDVPIDLDKIRAFVKSKMAYLIERGITGTVPNLKKKNDDDDMATVDE